MSRKEFELSYAKKAILEYLERQKDSLKRCLNNLEERTESIKKDQNVSGELEYAVNDIDNLIRNVDLAVIARIAARYAAAESTED